MSEQQPPAPRFARFERVVVRCSEAEVAFEARGRHRYDGREGVVVWQESYYVRGKRPLRQWLYVVYVPGAGRYPIIAEGDLCSLGRFDPPEAHAGQAYEYSFDTVVAEGDDYRTLEGCYRTPGNFWRVMVFCKWPGVKSALVRPSSWESGIEGLDVAGPEGARLDRSYVRQTLARAFATDAWDEIPGPDSLTLR